jgi:hypothetical protein
MTPVVLTLCLAVVGFATAQMVGPGAVFVLLLGVVVVGPYLLGVPPRSDRDWLGIKICVILQIVLLLIPWMRLISR